MQAFSLLLIAVGIASDVIAGLAILEHQAWRGVVLHLAATLIWIAGMVILGVRHPTPIEAVEQSRGLPGIRATLRRIAPPGTLHGHTTVAIVLGLFLFPGLGPLGCSLAFGLAQFLGRQRQQATDAPDDFSSPDLWSVIGRVVNGSTHPLNGLETQPLVEILKKPDFKLKRAAIELICREPGPRAMSLARSALTDPDPDVRGLAAVAVSRLEAHLGAVLREAVVRREDPSHMAGLHAATGNLYYQYACNASSNPMIRRFYLAQARKALNEAVSRDPTRYDCLLTLAEVLMDLGEEQKAWEAVAKVNASRPDHSGAYLRGMAIAFRERKFDKVADLAELACKVSTENDEALPLMKWWLEAKPSREAETS